MKWKFLESRCSAHLCRGVLCAGAPVVYVFELFAPFSPPESHSELFDVGASYFFLVPHLRSGCSAPVF